MLYNLDSVSFERRHTTWMVGHQADTAQIEIKQNLSPDPNLALSTPFAFQATLVLLPFVKLHRVRAINPFMRESKRVLMQVNNGAGAFADNSL